MDLLENPFHILGATTRDNRHRIMELAEERSLLSDADACMEAQAILTIPRRRISAEVAWLPGIDPRRTDEVLEHLDAPNQNLLNITGLMHITRANILTTGLSRLPNLASANIVEWILAIAQASEAINSEAVCAVLNEDRSASGFSEIRDLSTIDDEIRKQRQHYRQVITSVLENLSFTERARVLTLAVEWSTGNDKFQCPILIEDLILSYELGVQEFLEKKQKIIEVQDEKLRAMIDAKNPDTTLKPVVSQLIEAVKEWGTIAQPIQLSKKSRGERHTTSFEIAWRVRELAIHLFNEYGKLDFSQSIINILKEVFAEVVEVDERITADSEALKQQAIFARGIEKIEDINTQVEKLKEASDAKKPNATLALMVNQLIQTVKTWDTSTQPTEANNVVAIAVRNIALHLWNEHQKLDFAIQITDMLFEVFVNSRCVGIEVATRLTEDKGTLIYIDGQRESEAVLRGVHKRIEEQREIEEQRKHQNQPAYTGCLWPIVIFVILGLIGALLQSC